MVQPAYDGYTDRWIAGEPICECAYQGEICVACVQGTRFPLRGIRAWFTREGFERVGTGGGCEAAVKTLESGREVWIVDNLGFPRSDAPNADVFLIDPERDGEEQQLLAYLSVESLAKVAGIAGNLIAGEAGLQR